MNARWPWGAALVLAGCSLVGLSDDITQGHCRSDADCDELNDERTLDADPCMRWRCDEAEQLCAYRALDADRDGQSPASVRHDGERVTCEPDEALQDCDDDNAERARGRTEVCDGIDNDCDGRTDEGVLEVDDAERVVLFEGGSRLATQVSYAYAPLSAALAIGYSLNDMATPHPGLNLLGLGVSGEYLARPIRVGSTRPRGTQVAVAALQGRLAYAYLSLAGTPQLVAGLAGGNGELSIAPQLAERGVACLDGEACSGASPVVRTIVSPVMAAIGDRALLAYLRWGGAADAGCGSLIDAPSQPLLLGNLLELRGDELLERSVHAIDLGSSADLSPPALAVLPALGADRDSGGYLLGRIDAAGRVVIDRVQITGDALAVTQPALLQLGEEGQPHSGVALALAELDGGELRLAVAYQRGCEASARVIVGLYRVIESGGALWIAPVGEEASAGDGARQGGAALAFWELPEGPVLGLVYRDAEGLRARLFGADGRAYARDEAPYTLIANAQERGRGVVDVQLVPALLPAFAGDGFIAIAHVLRSAEQTSPRAFERVRLGCAQQ